MRIEKKLEKKAVRLFDSFNLNEIDIVSFENSLLQLSKSFVQAGLWDKKTVDEEFIPCLKLQFVDYKAGETYLLGKESGSLLHNFKCNLN